MRERPRCSAAGAETVVRGWAMAEEFCQDCGEPAAPAAEFCLACGAFLPWVRGRGAARPAAAGEGRGSAPGAPTWLTRAAPSPAGPPLGVAPAQPGCRRCGTGNPPHLRFCRHCGLEFRPATGPLTVTVRAVRPVPWWRRLSGGGRPPAERAALRAYRRSLPLRFRVFRVAGATLVALLLVAAGLAVRSDPVDWIRDRWYDVRNTVEPVVVTGAQLDPAGPELPQFGPGLAIDGAPGTAWGTRWDPASVPGGCGARRTSAGLFLTLDRAADLRRVRVLAGLPTGDGNRLLQWRPRVLELRFSDGSCQRLPVADTGEEQDVALPSPVSTTSVLVDVVEVYPRADGSSDVVAISEIALLARPPR